MNIEIRKEFKFELAHIVRNAWSRRCSMNVHWHSYRAELFLEGLWLDNWEMLLDFWLVKHWVNDFMDSFDHTCMLWNREVDSHVTEFFVKNFERVIVTPFSSSAERQAQFIALMTNRIVTEYLKTEDANWGNAHISGCRIHETTTWFAEYRLYNTTTSNRMLLPIKIFKQEDYQQVIDNPEYIWISEQVYKEYKNPDWIIKYNNSLI